MLTRGVLQTILTKLTIMSNDPNYRWTKWDSKLYMKIQDEMKLVIKLSNKK